MATAFLMCITPDGVVTQKCFLFRSNDKRRGRWWHDSMVNKELHRQMPAKALIVYHEEASLQDHLSLYGRSCFLVLLELKRKIQEIIMYTLLTLWLNNEWPTIRSQDDGVGSLIACARLLNSYKHPGDQLDSQAHVQHNFTWPCKRKRSQGLSSSSWLLISKK